MNEHNGASIELLQEDFGDVTIWVDKLVQYSYQIETNLLQFRVMIKRYVMPAWICCFWGLCGRFCYASKMNIYLEDNCDDMSIQLKLHLTNYNV